jgi:23S rRNA (adenine2503-C2)-methyltransferase
MRIVKAMGKEAVATVYIADMGQEKLVEFTESVQSPLPREEKWVLIISTLFGCPIKCLMCDAGDTYRGRLSKNEMFDQIDYLIRKRFPDGVVPVKKFKIQFSRIGEPSFNVNVIDLLDEMQQRYEIPGFIPSISTVAPEGTDIFFERLLELKHRKFKEGKFQLQFSIHTTDARVRDKLVPVKKWSFSRIARYADEFYVTGDRKITLNFALAQGMPVNAKILAGCFSPEKFIIKITPINPTYTAMENNLRSYIDAYNGNKDYDIIDALRSEGYEVILSIGEVEENDIGSNCGQFVMKHLKTKKRCGEARRGYDYWRHEPAELNL